MISRYDKPVCIRAGGDAPNQVDDFRNRFLTGNENFVLGIRFVPTGIDLVVVHINQLFAGENTAEIGNLERFDTVKLDTYAVHVVFLQNCFPLDEIFAGKPINQHLEIIRHRQFRVRKQCRHTETGVGR